MHPLAYLYSGLIGINMKFAKILFILLVSVLGVVGCEKSTVKPGCPEDKAMADDQKVSSRSRSGASSDAAGNSASMGNARAPKPGEVTSPGSGDGSDIIGSGDEDREGGKKNKSGTR